MYEPIPNTTGFDLTGYRGVQRLKEALRPYSDYEHVRDEIRRLDRAFPKKESKNA